MTIFNFEDATMVELEDGSQFLVEGFIHKSITVIFGKPKSGKSYLSLSLADALNNGTPWMGQEFASRKVAFWLLDPGQKTETAMRVQKLDIKPGLLLFDDRPIYGDDRWWISLRDQLVDAGVEVLFIDNLTSLTPPEASIIKDEDVKPTLSRLSQISDAGIAIVLIHHKGKASEDLGNNKTTPMGATCIEAWGRHFIDVTNHGDSLVQLRAYGNDVAEVSTFVAFDPGDRSEEGEAFFAFLDKEDRTEDLEMHQDVIELARARLADLRKDRSSRGRTVTGKPKRTRTSDNTIFADIKKILADAGTNGIKKGDITSKVKGGHYAVSGALDKLVSDNEARTERIGTSQIYYTKEVAV